MDSDTNTEEGEWVELRWVVSRHMIDLASSFLFAVGAQGVQEEYLEGQKPPPKQPWDTGPLPEEPAEKYLISWWDLNNPNIFVKIGNNIYKSMIYILWIYRAHICTIYL